MERCLGRKETPPDRNLCLVFWQAGPTPEREAFHDLGPRLLLGGDGGHLGPGTRDLTAAIGIDEINSGAIMLTLVYQIDAGCRRLLWIGKKRRLNLLGFFRWFGKERTKELDYICSDMWKPYLRVIAKRQDKRPMFWIVRIMSNVSKAIDKVRAQEAKELKGRVMIRC